MHVLERKEKLVMVAVRFEPHTTDEAEMLQYSRYYCPRPSQHHSKFCNVPVKRLKQTYSQNLAIGKEENWGLVSKGI